MTSFSGALALFVALLFLSGVLQTSATQTWSASCSDNEYSIMCKDGSCPSSEDHRGVECPDIYTDDTQYVLRSPREEKSFTVKTLEVLQVLIYMSGNMPLITFFFVLLVLSVDDVITKSVKKLLS